MAIEKLIMMNVVGKNEYVDQVIRDILLFENIQVVDAYNEIEKFRFSMSITDKHMDEIEGFSEARSGLNSKNSEEFSNKAKLLKELYDKEYKIDKNILKGDLHIEQVIKTVNDLYEETHSQHENLKRYEYELEEIKKSIQAYQFLSSANVEMERINHLENFHYAIGTFSKENISRLKRNYSRITAIVVHVGALKNEEVYVVIWPKDLEVETNRILKSLNFQKLEGIRKEDKGTPSEIVSMLKNTKEDLEKKISKIYSEIKKIKEEYREKSNYAYNVLHLYEKIYQVKKKMAFSKEYFYFSGWIPVRLKQEIKTVLSKYKEIHIMFDDEDKNQNRFPPTRLKNNWLFKPFESFLKMYGIPSYDEVDPTPFLSISYLFLFGFMFGDVGQGLVFFLVGMLLTHIKGMKSAAVLSRLGISSIVFGFLYGSVFGFETILPALWLKPFDNINTLLIVSIGIGVILLTIGYIYGMINNYKMKDYYNMILSDNGLIGLILYFGLLLLVVALFTGNRIISLGVLGVVVVVLIAILFMKEPIIQKLSHQKEQLDGNFFVESFFEIFEILLSIFSNTLSFIRVGAFALNHVGLFVAFETLAQLIESGVGSTIVYIIGNIFIIGLEGLIVGIQALRLQYYELFNKYYIGGGEEFKAAKL